MRIILFLGICILFTSCATVFGSRYNTLKFDESIPDEARVYIDGEDVGVPSEGKIKIPATLIQDQSQVKIVDANGSILIEATIERKVHLGYFVADFLAPAVSHSVDFMSGNIYRPYPRNFSLNP